MIVEEINVYSTTLLSSQAAKLAASKSFKRNACLALTRIASRFLISLVPASSLATPSITWLVVIALTMYSR